MTDAKDTYPEKIKIKAQIKDPSITILARARFFIDSPITTPKDVAIPFPPLNLKNTGQLWPHMLATPRSNLNVSLETLVSFINSENRITGISPFEISRIKAGMPILYPAWRKALVAPILPEPILRRSIPFKVLTRINAKGIDPKR